MNNEIIGLSQEFVKRKCAGIAHSYVVGAIKSPAASMSIVQNITTALHYGLPWNWDEKYDAGVHKDKNKFLHNAAKLIQIICCSLSFQLSKLKNFYFLSNPFLLAQ